MFKIKTSYMSCGGVVAALQVYDSHDEAIAFAYGCIASHGYDQVTVLLGDDIVLSYCRLQSI